MLTIRDWRHSPPSAIDPLYRIEVARSRAALNWDTTAVWRIVEAARTAGALPGFVAHDRAGRIHGWTFHLLHDGVMQIGALTAASAAATAAIVDALLASPEAAAADRLMLFAFTNAPRLVPCLSALGFQLDRYHYLTCSLGEAAMPAEGLRAWAAGDAAAVIELLASAYPGSDPLRPFAAEGRPDQWSDYVTQLLETSGVGTFCGDASVVAAGPDGVRGAALVTRLADQTAHLAQIAVHPSARGRGLGRRLVSAAMQSARARGCARMTLLVSERNMAARALYRTLAFQPCAQYLSAARFSPADRGATRSPRVA